MDTMAEKTAKEGDTVKIHYTGTFDDGNVFDSSEKRDPIEFVVGEGKVIKGFDKAVTGMKVDEEKDVKISPAQGYGERDDRLVRPFPKSKLPPEPKPQPGMILSLKGPNGQTVMAKIDSIDGDDVLLDFNHPLAGKNLNFKLRLVEVK